MDLSFSHSTQHIFTLFRAARVEINLKANVYFFKSVYIPLSTSCTYLRPSTAWECLPQFGSRPTVSLSYYHSNACTCLYTYVASSSDSLLSASHLSHGSHSSRSGPSCTCLYTSVASSSDSLLSASHQADVMLAPGRSTVAIPASGSCTSSRQMRSLDLSFQNPLDQWEVCGGGVG